MSQKHLEHKLNEIEQLNKVKEPRKNINEKVGINKSNNYMPIPNAPRKKIIIVVLLTILLLIGGGTKILNLLLRTQELRVVQFGLSHRILVFIVAVFDI